jgi:hypothetical protein
MRPLPLDVRRDLTSPSNGEVYLIACTIEHADLTTLRVISEGVNGVSHWNGLPVNYTFDGATYLGCPFEISLLTDNESPPRAKFAIFDADRAVGRYFIGLTQSPRLKIEILRASDFGAIDDTTNARTATGSPRRIYRASNLRLTSITGDPVSVSGEIKTYDPRSEPWPKQRAHQTLLPGIYRR